MRFVADGRHEVGERLHVERRVLHVDVDEVGVEAAEGPGILP